MDFKTAFDRASLDSLWNVIRCFNIKGLFKTLHNLSNNKQYSPPDQPDGGSFQTHVGVWQGYLLMLTIFNFFLAVRNKFTDLPVGFSSP
jgi:hypothetical protein